MCAHACICVCMHAYTHVCTHAFVCMCVSACVCMCTCVLVDVHVCPYVRAHAHIHVCACLHMCARECICVHVFMCVHAFTCVWVCARVHAHVCACVCMCSRVCTCVCMCSRVCMRARACLEKGRGRSAAGLGCRHHGVGVPARSGSYTSNQWAPMQARFHSQPQFQHHSSWHWGCGHFMCMHPPAGRGHRLSAGERSSPHPPHTRAAPERALHGHHPERAEENQPERARAFRGAACSKSAPSTEGAARVSTRASTFPLPKWGLETSASRRTDGIKSFLNDVLNSIF